MARRAPLWTRTGSASLRWLSGKAQGFFFVPGVPGVEALASFTELWGVVQS